MSSWKQYYDADARWVSLSDCSAVPIRGTVIGQGVAADPSGRSRPFLIVATHRSNVRWRVRVNATSWTVLSKEWGENPEQYVGRRVVIAAKQITTAKGPTTAIVITPDD